MASKTGRALAMRRPCRNPGCPAYAVERSAYCAEHTRDHQREADRRRGSAHKRGYGARWRRLRRMVLSVSPLCTDPFGVHAGGVVVATDVDHIIPRRAGGDDHTDNLQALCHSCHSRKTAAEHLHPAGRGVRISTSREPETGGTASRTQPRVVVVGGPPGSGKTGWVEERRRWGDLVIDLDALYAALSGEAWYEKPQSLLGYVLAARDGVLDRLERQGLAEGVPHAWVITGEGSRRALAGLAERLGAELVVLEVDGEECLRRIANDPRRQGRWELWRPLVRKWWRRYERDE